MPVIPAFGLRRSVRAIFGASGCPDDVAARVADSLVEANLTGHDSHGVIRVPSYLRAMNEGRIDPHGEIRIAQESANTAVLDCAHTFGQVGALRAVEVATSKARSADVAAVALRRSGHVGRLGEYVDLAAGRGYVALMIANGISLSFAIWIYFRSGEMSLALFNGSLVVFYLNLRSVQTVFLRHDEVARGRLGAQHHQAGEHAGNGIGGGRKPSATPSGELP